MENLKKYLLIIVCFAMFPLVAWSEDWAISLDKSFYMTGDDLNDLYINVTVEKGTISENQEIEIVKKSNPSERISATIYRIDNRSFKQIKTGKAGQEVILYLKVKNDKKFALGYTGDLYNIVKKGASSQTAVTTKVTTSDKASILLNGKAWKYNYFKGYYYTKNYGVTKGPANILLTFTQPSSVLKQPAEEQCQIVIYTDAKSPKKYDKQQLEITFRIADQGKEKVYSRNRTFEQNAQAEITQYTEKNGKAYISGKFTSDAKVFLCSSCPKGNIEVVFENLELELYNQ